MPGRNGKDTGAELIFLRIYKNLRFFPIFGFPPCGYAKASVFTHKMRQIFLVKTTPISTGSDDARGNYGAETRFSKKSFFSKTAEHIAIKKSLMLGLMTVNNSWVGLSNKCLQKADKNNILCRGGTFASTHVAFFPLKLYG